jgi:hypothetical protein
MRTYIKTGIAMVAMIVLLISCATIVATAPHTTGIVTGKIIRDGYSYFIMNNGDFVNVYNLKTYATTPINSTYTYNNVDIYSDGMGVYENVYLGIACGIIFSIVFGVLTVFYYGFRNDII